MILLPCIVRYQGVDETTNPDLKKMAFMEPTAVASATGAHAIAIMTEWDEFKTYDYKALYDVMQKPAFIFDGRNILDHAALREIGFEVYVIGRGQPL